MPEKCTDNPRDCPLVPRVEALEEANRNHSRVHEGMYDRLRALEKENAVQNAHWKNVDGKLDELTSMVKELTGKAGKRWDKLAETVLVAIVTGVVCFLLGRLGL